MRLDHFIYFGRKAELTKFLDLNNIQTLEKLLKR